MAALLERVCSLAWYEWLGVAYMVFLAFIGLGLVLMAFLMQEK